MKTDSIICYSYEDVENTINKVKRPGIEFVFRGLPRDSYALQTRIEDKLKNKITANESVRKMIGAFENLIKLNGIQNEIYVDDFPFKRSNYKNDWYLLCQAQHLRIPTMLMDWSTDWMKALFFAVFDMRNESESGLLWCFNVTSYTSNDDLLRSNSIYLSNPFDYKGVPRIINPSFELDTQGCLAIKRIDYQSGRFFINSLDSSIDPLENQDCFKNRLTKIVITPSCKSDVLKKYCTPQEVPIIFANLQGVYYENGKYYKKFDDHFFYGNCESLDKIVCKVRADEGFDK